MMASAAKGGGTKIIVASAPVFSTAWRRYQKREAVESLPAIAGRHAADHLRSIILAVRGVEHPPCR